MSKKQSLGQATGFEDKTQGTLFFDVCRILKAKRPKAFMLENVKNLKSHDRGRTFRIITESLEELNYEVFHAILDGQNYVPQHRERILIIGFDRERYGTDIDFQFDITPADPKPVMRDILEENVDDKYTLSDKLNISVNHYGHMEQGTKGCSIDLLLEIADILQVSTDYLLLGRCSKRESEIRKLKDIAEEMSDLIRQMS